MKIDSTGRPIVSRSVGGKSRSSAQASVISGETRSADSVDINPVASQMAAAEQEIRERPAFDAEKVAAIKDAIAAGKEAAVSIHRFVHPGQSQLIGRDHRDYKSLDPATVAVPIESFDNTPRQHAHDGSAEEAKKTFHDLRGVFTEEQMKIETSRCLGCGAAGNAPAAVAKLVTKKIARK